MLLNVFLEGAQYCSQWLECANPGRLEQTVLWQLLCVRAGLGAVCHPLLSASAALLP